ncbi:hypothetical protein PJO47_29455, partial [Mycobacterium kansasii]
FGSKRLVPMRNSKNGIEKYSCKNNFELWKVKMINQLTKQEEYEAIEKRQIFMSDDDWKTLDKKAKLML